MSENSLILWAAGQMLFGVLDFVIMYLIAHALMWKSIEIKKQHVLFAIVFAILISLISYFLSGWSGRIIHHLLLVAMFKKIIKRADWEDMLIIYLIWVITGGVIQGMFLITAGLFSVDGEVAYLIGKILTTVSVFGLCKLFKWYRLFHAVRANIILKLILAILSLAFLVMMFILNFEFDFLYILSSTMAIVLLGVVLSPLFITTYQKVTGIISTDDLKTNLFITALDMIEESDPKMMYQIYAELAKQYGVDVASFPEDKKKSDEAEADMEKAKVEIQQFIQRKIEQSGKILEVDATILYSEEHEEIDFKCAKEWMGILLEHLLKTATNKSIHVYLFSMADSFRLKVAGQCVIEEWALIEEMLKQGASIEDDENSIRLQALYQKVGELKGKFWIKPSYMAEHACHYLQISIELEKEDNQSS